MNSDLTIVGERRGFALLTVILITLLWPRSRLRRCIPAGNAGLIGTSSDREREFKYGAEAAMAIGKSRLNTDPLALPDTGYSTIISAQPVLAGADGVPARG